MERLPLFELWDQPTSTFLNSGDEILAVGGRVATSAEIARLVAESEPGESLDLMVSRRGRVIQLSASLVDASDEATKIAELPSAAVQQRQVLEAWLG